LVEDEYLVADDIAVAFARLGITTVGPVPTLGRAMEIVDSTCHLDGAVLDINLRGEMVIPLVAALMRRGVPFIFATGYDQGNIPQQYCDVP
jgi:hypothetical protein